VTVIQNWYVWTIYSFLIKYEYLLGEINYFVVTKQLEMRLQLNISINLCGLTYLLENDYMYMETGIESYDVHSHTKQKVCI